MSGNLARTERTALADLLEEVGPDVPTLCEGWNTADLMAHLLVRERRMDASAGMFISPLAGHLATVTRHYRQQPWADQLALLRSGPPAWNPLGWGRLDELTNGGEFFIHHEDARRGVDGWQPRILDTETTAALTKMLASPAIRMMARGTAGGISAQLPSGRTIVLKKPSGEDPGVTLVGEPGEILLWLSGRDACRVELTGSAAAVAAATAGRTAK